MAGTGSGRLRAAGWLTARQVADRFGVRVQTVTHWIRRGLLPATRNGAWFVRETDAARFTPPRGKKK
jgi:predicted site-specific integrase-resolvase